jgi:hypothetical protein
MRKGLSGVAVLGLATLLFAERPPQGKALASHVIVGTIEKISTKEMPFGGDGVQTDYTAEVKLDKVERGSTLKPGDTITLSWFNVTRKPSKFFAGAYGHAYDVKEKDTIRAWMLSAGKAGQYRVIYNADGVEKVKE